jgi:hypothetical protein
MAIVLEVSADGSLTLPAELLEGMKTARYSVARNGNEVLVSPESEPGTSLTHDEWMKRWAELARRMDEKWPEGLTAVDAVNAIRR